MSPTTSTEFTVGREVAAPSALAAFKLSIISAALRVREIVSRDDALHEFSFLDDYAEEAAELCGVSASREDLSARFREHVDYLSVGMHSLPLRALASAAQLEPDALDLLLTIGIIEEDPRFGPLFEWAQPGCPGQQRPTRGLLTAWWRDADDCSSIRSALARLSELGLISVIHPDAPRLYWAYEPNPILWDVLRGDFALGGASWLSYRPASALPDFDSLMLPPAVEQKLAPLSMLLASGQASAVMVRGPLRNGRKTMLGAIAGRAGFGVIEVERGCKLDGARPSCLGTLCILLSAWPVFTFELGPGETASVPALGAYRGPQAFAVSRHGTLEGKIFERSVQLELPLPDPGLRRRIWAHALHMHEATLPDWTDRFRLTSGGILLATRLARGQALLDGASDIDDGHVRRGERTLQQPLENLARRLDAVAGWADIVAAPEVLSELQTLLNRCRFRESLACATGPALPTCGVRALLGGPSGSGKTLAARVIASELGLDLYRMDLSAIVNKYIGETEKNLNEIFSRAEELNVIVLLDEGDALLANRTAVQTSNDRYANLETNFLLQRIDTFEGILLITTNALQRIDSAFLRRMDVLIEFRLPEAEERRQIWRLHLPPYHEVDDVWINEVAIRCNLSGGQIRNAALHASMLALARNSRVNTADVAGAVFREYQKLGAVCPLRRSGGR